MTTELFVSSAPTARTVTSVTGLTTSDVAYKYYTQKYGASQRIRIWNSTTAAKKDATLMKRRGYKVKMTPDNKAVIVLGKTSRGVERTQLGRRAMASETMRQPGRTPGMPQHKPYGPDYATFRQPSYTMRKMGWSR